MRRYRPAISVALFVVVGILVPISALSVWAGNTIFDSDTFSRRAVEVLDSEVARKELASKLTEQLALSGNQQAINFRPAFQFAVEVATDTDTFRTIFRNAVKKVHESILAGRDSGIGLDLSDSLGIITNTVALRTDGGAAADPATGTPPANQGLASTLTAVTDRLAQLRIWDLEDIIGAVALATALLAVGLAAAGIAVALDRRQAIVRLGFALVLGGSLLLLLRVAAGWAVTSQISESQLSDAIGAALSRTTDDLKLIGLWLIGYGVVVAAAASHVRLTPTSISERTRAWAGRRRGSKRGTVGLAALLIFWGLLVTLNPWFWVQMVAYVAGLWFVYLGVWELVHLVRVREPGTVEAAAIHEGNEKRRLLVAGGAIAAVLVLITVGFLFVTRRAGVKAAARGEQVCNGDRALCEIPLDEVVFPGTHNSMSSSLYPGWLMGEHVRTIKQQLQAGVRALLIDTHYGIPTTVRLPGSDNQLIVTDVSAELATPQGEPADPVMRARAAALRDKAKPSTNAQRGIYLCHNFCEMGAITFASALTDVKQFLDANPDEVVTLIIQDATTPAETAKAIEAAGLGNETATLRKGEDLPTLADLIDQGKRLLVFAEQGGDGAPDWYMKAYDWFQETGYNFKTVGDFNCTPNRGSSDNPLFLLNHWVEAAPPDPSKAEKANASDVLESRIQKCADERGLIPNVVAVDFSERGNMVAVVADLDDQIRHLVAQARRDASATTTIPVTTTTTTTVPPTTTTVSGPTTTLPPSVLVTDLSGGDPAAFCAVFPDALATIRAWALVTLTTDPADQGAVDMTFAPLLTRLLTPYLATAPTKIAELAQPLQARMTRALTELRTLVPDQKQIESFADNMAADLKAPESDPLTVELDSEAAISEFVGAAQFDGVADRLAAASDDQVYIDLGTVSPALATANGYACINDSVTVGG